MPKELCSFEHMLRIYPHRFEEERILFFSS